MRKLIKDIGQGDRTVLLSSHLLGELEQICVRVGVLSNGKLAVAAEGAAGAHRLLEDCSCKVFADYG